MKETDTIKVYADLPGIKREDVQIELNNGIFTILGERKARRMQSRLLRSISCCWSAVSRDGA